MYNKREPQQPQKPHIRANANIRVPNVRVVQDGEQLGIMATSKAQKIADDAGVDLVEVVPQANPPVCWIVPLDKYKFDIQQKKKEQEKRQRETQIETKEVRFRPVTGDHDIDTKVKSIKEFLSGGDKVQLNVEFKKNRELSHREEGYAIINKVLSLVEDVAVIEMRPRMEGRRIFARLSPKEDAKP